MKINKVFLSLVCFVSSIAILGGCKKKTTKSTETTKITTNTTTKQTTTKKTTTSIKTTEDKIENYQVNKNTFNSIFKISSMEELKALNFTCTYTGSPVYSEKISMSNGALLIETKNTDSGVETRKFVTVEESINPSFDLVYHMYEYNSETGNWDFAEGANVSFDTFMRTIARVIQFDFDAFTFNENTKSYEASEIEVAFMESYTNIKVEFHNDKVVKESFTYNKNDKSWDRSCSFSKVGTTEVISPLE